MDNFGGDGSGENYDVETHMNNERKHYQRHSPEQIQRLEAFFKDVPHPNESQQKQLGKELGLEPQQIKFWFQNKRTQVKTQNGRADSNSLRMENERLHCENIALKQALNNIVCPKCNGPAYSNVSRHHEVVILQNENSRPENEYVGWHDQLSSLSRGLSDGLYGGSSGVLSAGLSGGLLSGKVGSSFQGLTNEMGCLRSISVSAENMLSPGRRSVPLICIQHPLGNLRGTLIGIKENPGHLRSPSIGIENPLDNLRNPLLNGEQPFHNLRNVNPTQYQFNGITDTEKSAIVELCLSSVKELEELVRTDEPLWIKSPSDGKFKLVRDYYEKFYPKANRFNTSSARVESSKDSGIVAMNPPQLVDMFMDPDQWMNMFPNMVTKASVLDTIDTGGSMCLMHAKMHILSPLVAARDFIFVRHVRKLDQNVWMIVDVSYDISKELYDPSSLRAWRHPSGCMIQDLCNGNSKLTWIEHVQDDDKYQNHHLYHDLVCVSQAYGATRWIVTLQRMCERVSFSMGTSSAPTHGLEIEGLETRRNFMKLSHRLVKSFCENLCAWDNIIFPNMSEMNISGVRISFRKNEKPGAPIGLILSASSSMWFSLSVEQIFNFLLDNKERAKWDILVKGNPVEPIARITTGSNFLGNNISILQTVLAMEQHMLLLQESFIDSLGALIVYAPIDLGTITSLLGLEDPDRVSILPTGFVISSNGHGNKAGSGDGASGSSSARKEGGSLLTMSYQIIAGDITGQIDQAFVAAANNLLSSAIQKIKGGLGYDFD